MEVRLGVVAVERESADVLAGRAVHRVLDLLAVARAEDRVSPPVGHEVLADADLDDGAARDEEAWIRWKCVRGPDARSPPPRSGARRTCTRWPRNGTSGGRMVRGAAAVPMRPLAAVRTALRDVEMKACGFGLGVDGGVGQVGVQHGRCQQIAHASRGRPRRLRPRRPRIAARSRARSAASSPSAGGVRCAPAPSSPRRPARGTAMRRRRQEAQRRRCESSHVAPSARAASPPPG